MSHEEVLQVDERQLAKGYVVLLSDGSIENRPYELIRELPNGTAIVKNPIADELPG